MEEGVKEGVGEGRWGTTGVAAVVFAVQTVWRPSGSGEAKARSVCPANTSACPPLLTKKLTQHLCPGKDDHHTTGHLWAAAAWSAGLHALREGQCDPEMRTDGSRQPGGQREVGLAGITTCIDLLFLRRHLPAISQCRRRGVEEGGVRGERGVRGEGVLEGGGGVSG